MGFPVFCTPGLHNHSIGHQDEVLSPDDAVKGGKFSSDLSTDADLSPGDGRMLGGGQIRVIQLFRRCRKPDGLLQVLSKAVEAIAPALVMLVSHVGVWEQLMGQDNLG